MQEDNQKKSPESPTATSQGGDSDADVSHNDSHDGAPQTLAVEGDTQPPRQKMADTSESDGDDDETWTNVPAGAGSLEDSANDDVDDEDEEKSPVVTRKVIQNARDVICEELPARAERAKLRLRPQLTGAFLIEVSNTGEKFIFDWRGQEPKVTPAEGTIELATAESSDPSKVDSIISLSDQHLMAIRSGDLNPQVAMLADKIRVKGKMGPAVYLFNLVAPRIRD